MNALGEKNRMGRVTINVSLANNEDILMSKRGHLPPEQIRRVDVPGIVDTGATHLVIPQWAADQLGLPIKGEMQVRYADHRSARRTIADQIRLELLGRDDIFSAIIEPARDTVLIGAIVMEHLDLLVDCTHQTLMPRDPAGMIAEIE